MSAQSVGRKIIKGPALNTVSAHYTVLPDVENSRFLYMYVSFYCTPSILTVIPIQYSFAKFILLHEKFLQFDWLRAVVFQLNLKYLHEKITTFCG